MIKFFRNIRKQLLGEGNTVKYLKYAIGEIVLVVIGILIALSINNWNEGRIESKTVKGHYESLITSLQEDIENLNSYIEIQSFRAHSLCYILEFIGEDCPSSESDNNAEVPFYNSFIWNENIPDIINKDFIEKAFSWSFRYRPFILNQKAINEFESTGMYSVIDNVDLKIEINNYYSEIKWRLLSDQLNNGNINIELWQREMTNEGVYLMDLTKHSNPLSLVKESPKRIAIIKYMIADSNWRANNSIEFIKMGKKIIQMIEQEIRIN